jgi:prefoldin beta subunit
MASVIEARQRLDAQQSENEQVLKVSSRGCGCVAVVRRLPPELAMRTTSRIHTPAYPSLQLPPADRQEFASLKPHNTVYKLIGPGLVQQDPAEAKTNVEKRLEFIKSEM